MMINMKPEIKEALKTLGCPVTTEYPESMPTLPSITFYEATNQDANASDDEAAEAYIEFYIQVWGNGTEQIEPLSQGVDELMKGMGFWRTFGTDDLSGEVKRKIMRYTISKEA